MGPQQAKVEGVNVTATGDGQKLALPLGARIVNGDLALGPEIRFIAPARTTLVRRLPPWRALARTMDWAMGHVPSALLRPFIMGFLTTALAPSPKLFEQGAVLVNQAGRRFCDELDAPALALPDQPGKIGYILIDARLARQFSAWPHFVSTAPGVAYAYVPDYRRNRPDVYTEAPSLTQLATRLGRQRGRRSMPQSPSTMPRCRPNLPGGGGLPWSTRPSSRSGRCDRCSCTTKAVLPWIPGIACSARKDSPIPGLYAAGATGQGGLLLKGHGHHLAWAFVSGRRAGRFAADEHS